MCMNARSSNHVMCFGLVALWHSLEFPQPKENGRLVTSSSIQIQPGLNSVAAKIQGRAILSDRPAKVQVYESAITKPVSRLHRPKQSLKPRIKDPNKKCSGPDDEPMARCCQTITGQGQGAPCTNRRSWIQPHSPADGAAKVSLV